MLKIDLESAVSAIKGRKAKIVLLQLPEGLKTRNIEIASELEKKTGAAIVSTIDPCFGACDLAENSAKQINADLIVHLGHTRFFNPEVETIFVPLEYEIDKKKAEKLVNECAELLKKKGIKKICFSSTIQYVKFLETAKKEFERKGISVEGAQGKGLEKSQVLGCNYSGTKGSEEAVVFFGDGLFHPLGIAFCSKKPVFAINPLAHEVKELEKEKDLFLRKRFAIIEKAMDAQKFGILVSNKKGQFRMQKALELKETIEKHHKKAFLFVGDLIKPDYLLGVEVDAFVCTACPRIAIDDASAFKKPLLNPSELKIALGEKKLEEYEIEEFF
jgi:2-(3-amino-3-carboxypropyl)histidine synthase